MIPDTEEAPEMGAGQSEVFVISIKCDAEAGVLEITSPDETILYEVKSCE